MRKIGWIGTGVMGNYMCDRILAAGYYLSVYNRTKSKAEKLLEKGAKWCDTPKEVADNSDIVISIVGFPKDVEEVILGNSGILAGSKLGNIIVDMTTSDPSLAAKIYAKAKSKKVFSLDAPVSGGDIGARDGTLAIMVGGDKKAFDVLLPIFKLMGNNIAFVGKAGAGQHTKMTNQILLASTVVGVVEALLYGYKAGLDQTEVINVIGKGAAASWSINNLGPKMVQKDFNPGFFIKHFVKDMGLALAEAKKMNLALPGLALANQFYIAAMAMGFGNLGIHGLYQVFEKMNDFNE